MRADDQVVGDDAGRCSLSLGLVQQKTAFAIDDRVVHHNDVIDSLISVVGSTRSCTPAEDRKGGVPCRAGQILQIVVGDRVVAVDDSNAAGVLCTVSKKVVSFDGIVGVAGSDANGDSAARWSVNGTDTPRGVASSFHPGGANAVFSDGSSHVLSDNLNISVLRNLAAMADGNVVGEF